MDAMALKSSFRRNVVFGVIVGVVGGEEKKKLVRDQKTEKYANKIIFKDFRLPVTT